MIRGNDAYYTVHDFVKNVTEWIDDHGAIAASFDYTPTGHVFQKSGDTSLNMIGYSSEIMDHELGLVYYNYRHLNPLDGRWISRDFIFYYGSYGSYNYINNRTQNNIDIL
jgi:RHS repeat-associated protein